MIWKTRCTLVYDEVAILAMGMIQMIWKEICMYLKIKWLKLQKEVQEGKRSMSEVVEIMQLKEVWVLIFK